MAQTVSRRELANWAIMQLESGRSARTLARELASSLIASGRTKQFDLLISDILSELELRGKLAPLHVTTASKLSAELKKSLSDYVKQAAKVNKVITEESVDPKVIGGFRLETATRTWDKTVARQLADIKEGVTNG